MADLFKEKAQVWDSGSIRVNGAKVIADAIREAFDLNNDMEILDFGVGTGLLGFDVATSVKQVYGVDISSEMISKLKEKNSDELNIISFTQDIINEPLEQTFDGLISSMTLHHIENLKNFFDTIYKNIEDGGFIAIADLETEDGTFHSDNTGVFHFGFNKDSLVKIVKESGFKNVEFNNINTIKKPQRDFEVFLLSATR